MNDTTLDEAVIQQQVSQNLDGAFPRGPDDVYKSVYALLLFWEGDDLGCEREVNDLALLMDETFNYTAKKFMIPYSNPPPQAALNRRISDLLIKQDGEDHLLILYYGGHGRPEKCTRKAVWAATSDVHSPIVKWYNIQSLFDDAKGDVLIILDCCNAMLAGRGEESKLTILGASAMGVETPRAGDGSFTSGLMNSMKHLLKEHGSFSITQLQRDLLRLEVGLQQSAQYCDLSENTKRSIVLRPLKEKSPPPSVSLSNQASVTLTFSFLQSLDQNSTDEFTNWLKKSAPHSITQISVERVVQKCRILHDIVTQHNPTGRTGIALSTAVHQSEAEVIRDLQGMDNLVAMGCATNQSQSTEASSKSWNLIVSGLQNLSSNLTHTLKRTLLALEPLETLEGSPEIDQLGISNAIAMRKIVLGTENKSFPNVQSHITRSTHFEARIYHPSTDSKKIDSLRWKVEKIASLLSCSKRSDYRSLRCIDCLHNAEQHQFVLVFETPQGMEEKPISLLNLLSPAKISSHKTHKKLSLGKRFTICYELASAISEWHSIGWVHKNISSKDVYFYESKNHKSSIDGPFLGGFEYARPDGIASDSLIYVTNFEENVYRHPNRQDEPTESFKKIHDLYALGVLMLEVGLWKPVSFLFPAEMRQGLDPPKLQARLIDQCKSQLGHVMGNNFRNATIACLEGNFGVSPEEDDTLQTKLDAAFHEKVIKMLSQGMVL